MNRALMMVDLKSAYLQTSVTKKLWKHQLVRYKGKAYCLTRLGFGRSSVPQIMVMILKTILEKLERVKTHHLQVLYLSI